MPFQDVIQSHFTAAEQASFDTLMTQLEALLQPKLRNLDAEENQRYGVIDEQNKLFVNKVRDYRNSQPALSSPDVDWTEFSADGADRPFLENGALRLEGLTKAMTETRRLHDYDNYQNSLLDYSYTKYKNETQPGSGYDTKAAELKQFFDLSPGEAQNQLISGKVTSTQGGAPLPGGAVKLVETGETDITDADGNYSIPTAHSGPANLEFVFAGYLTETIPVDVPEGGELIFNMTLNPAP